MSLQVIKFTDESSELDESLNENSNELLESEILIWDLFCGQSQETVIVNRFLC